MILVLNQILDNIKIYNNISRDVILFNSVNDRLSKSLLLYSLELNLYAKSYNFSIKSLKEINKNL